MDITIIILDIIENSIEADAKNINVYFESREGNFNLEINDDGKGMSTSALQKAGLPGFSTKNTNRGMGLFQFRQYLKSHAGKIRLNTSNKGTKVSATWEDEYKSISEGLAETIMVLISRADEINFVFNISINNNEFKFSSQEYKKELDIKSYKDCEVLANLKNMIYKNINSMEGIYENNR